MSLDSSPSVNKDAEGPSTDVSSWVIRFVLAVALSLGIAIFIGATAWSKTPYSEAEIRSVETATESKIRELRANEITELRVLLGRRLPANRRADLYFRLAEIYLEGYRHEFLLEGRVHEKRLEAGKEDKLMDRAHSQPQLLAGINACKELLKLKIPYPRMDQIYYFLAFNYGELGQRKESVGYYDYLIRNFPNSVFTAEAYREVGDAAFEEGAYRRAQGAYESALKKAAPESVPRIYHKLAWCYYRMRNSDRAVETMKLAVSAASKNGEKFLSLKEESLRDMAVFMTESGRADEAVSYFQSVAGDKAFYPKVLEQLGRQYERNVEPGKATQVYESLLKTHPNSDSAFRVIVKLYDLDLRRGRFADALRRLDQAQLPSSSDSETQVALQNLRSMTRRTATEHHEEYRKKKARTDLEVAESFYATYLRKFLSNDDPRKETPEIQMYLAEVKRDLGKSKEASELYRKVVESRDKRYAKEAGALWTASLAEAIKRSAGSASDKSGAPSGIEREFVDAADQLRENLGETNEGREATLKAAQVLAGYKTTQKDAIRRLKEIQAQWPRSSQALTAAKLWIQLLEDNLDEMKVAITEIRANQGLLAADSEIGKGELRTKIGEQETRLRIGTIAKAEKEKDYKTAAKDYELFAADAKDRDIAEKAYANAIGAYTKMPDAEGIERVANAWMKRYPKSVKATDTVRIAATTLLIQGEFGASAKLFERLGREANDPDFHETAAKLHDGNGDWARAQQIRSRLIEAFPRFERKWSIALELAKTFEATGQDSEAGKAYKQCMKGGDEYEAECGARLGDLFLKTQNLHDARRIFHKVGISAPKKGRASSPFVGYARYRLAELMEKETNFAALELPEAKLKSGIQRRLDFLEKLSHAYQDAMEAGGPWGVAALDRLALWTTNFANDVDHIAPPPGAKPEAAERFRKNLSSVSDSLRKQAGAVWAESYRKAAAAGILSPVVPAIVDHLANARMTNGRAQGPRGKFRLAGIAPDGGADGSAVAFQKVRERLLRNFQDAQAWLDYGNLLWGAGKPGLARLMYERAIGLSPKNPAALNNQAVVLMTGDAQEDWLQASAAAHFLENALRQDEFFSTAKFNLASLYNYYRLFAKAKPYWDQVLAKNPMPDAQDGLGVALQGQGNLAQAEAAFAKASDLGASISRFALVFHQAAKVSLEGPSGAEKCLDRIASLDNASLGGFEKASVENLRKACSEWKAKK